MARTTDRQIQLRRGLRLLAVVIEVGPMTTNDLRGELNRRGMDVSKHTFYRDLQALDDLGMVKFDRESRLVSPLWRR